VFTSLIITICEDYYVHYTVFSLCMLMPLPVQTGSRRHSAFNFGVQEVKVQGNTGPRTDFEASFWTPLDRISFLDVCIFVRTLIFLLSRILVLLSM